MENDLQKYLVSTRIRQIKYFEKIESTNNEAQKWLNEGADDYSLVVADEQTAGRGRLNRRWITHPGSALAFSLVLRPNENETGKVALFSPLGGLAVSSAIQECFGIKAEIKWPNDVLINRKKVAGILVEADWESNVPRGIVLGIGINILHASIPSPEFQRFNATCLEDETGVVPDRFYFLDRVIFAIQYWRSKLGSEEFFNSWQEKLAFRNENIRIEQSKKQSIIGKVVGIDQLGNLVLQVDGVQMSFEVGDVHLSPCAHPTGGINAG